MCVCIYIYIYIYPSDICKQHTSVCVERLTMTVRIGRAFCCTDRCKKQTPAMKCDVGGAGTTQTTTTTVMIHCRSTAKVRTKNLQIWSLGQANS